MDTVAAFMMGESHRDKELKVFDWDKAAEIIKERGLKEASAGLSGDWSYTCDTIFADGQNVSKDDTYTYLASTWAIPALKIDGDIIDCYKLQSETPMWDENTYWPESAIMILHAK